MTFKRSAVRSRLSPPERPEIVRFQVFFCFGVVGVGVYRSCPSLLKNMEAPSIVSLGGVLAADRLAMLLYGRYNK